MAAIQNGYSNKLRMTEHNGKQKREENRDRNIKAMKEQTTPSKPQDGQRKRKDI